MKKLRIVLPALAFMLAIGGALGSALVQSGFYDSNDAQPLGGVQGTIDQTDETCGSSGSVICTIAGEWAFDTKLHAENNAGATSNESAVGLMKYVP